MHISMDIHKNEPWVYYLCVKLNGEEVRSCTAFDTELGWVEMWDVENGKLKVVNDNLVKVTKCGVVEVSLYEHAPDITKSEYIKFSSNPEKYRKEFQWEILAA
jgi:hypothetical protein